MENILTIFGILVVICLIYHFNKKFDSHVVIKAPAILTTIGIFFTFLGIGVGLLNFDVNEISRSIPKLLSGIKTAFWVSIAGIGGAIYIKIKDFFFQS